MFTSAMLQGAIICYLDFRKILLGNLLYQVAFGWNRDTNPRGRKLLRTPVIHVG